MYPIRVHYVTGNKGNVGKTGFATALIEFYRQHNCGLIKIDADNDSKTLSDMYQDSLLLALSDNPVLASQIDIIFRLAFAESRKKTERCDLLVDLPAGGEKAINKWMKECSLNQRAKEYDINFIKWWVCDSDPTSINLFEASLTEQPNVDHVFLKNMGRSEPINWEAFESRKSLQLLIKKKSIRVLEIPPLDSKAISRLRAGQVTLEKAASKDYLEVNVTDHLRVSGWLLRMDELIKDLVTFDAASKIRKKKSKPKSDVVEKVKMEEPAKTDTQKEPATAAAK